MCTCLSLEPWQPLTTSLQNYVSSRSHQDVTVRKRNYLTCRPSGGDIMEVSSVSVVYLSLSMRTSSGCNWNCQNLLETILLFSCLYVKHSMCTVVVCVSPFCFKGKNMGRQIHAGCIPIPPLCPWRC